MKLVIDVSEDDYRKVQDGRASVSMMQKTIRNGTPLPEGAEILTAEAYSDLCLRASHERKTGRWIDIAEYCKKNNLIPIGTEIFWWCSECNHPIANDYHRTAKFCPRCGAKMEGAEE